MSMKMKKSIFRAYDIRGKYPSEVNEKVMEKVAEKLAVFLNGSKIIVGYDTRLSSPALYRAAVKGLQASIIKHKIVKAGLITTPMLSFLVGKLKADGGIMVTASHDPKNYNGLKVLRRNAVAVSGEDIFKLLIA